MKSTSQSGDEGGPARVRRLGLNDPTTAPEFDGLARLTAKLLKVPAVIVSFLDEDSQTFKGCVGLPEPWATTRTTPLSHSFCRHVVDGREPLIIEFTRVHPLVRENPSIDALGIVAYLGVPLMTGDGTAVGSLCAVDRTERAWTDDEVATLTDLGEAVMAIVAARDRVDIPLSERRLRRMVDGIRDHAIFTMDPAGTITGWEAGSARMLGYEASEIVGRPARVLFTEEDRGSDAPGRELAAATSRQAEATRWLVRKDGSRVFAMGSVNPIRDEADGLIGYVKVVRAMPMPGASSESPRAAREPRDA